MVHREYRLKVVKDIVIHSGRGVTPVYYPVCKIVTVDQDTWERLKKGETIERPAHDGFIRYDKWNFANEVEWTEVTVSHGIAKLGLRNC
jgi:hypothetical protein